VLTRFTFLFPNTFNNLVVWISNACIERRSGVFLSNASPLYEQNAVGIHKIQALSVSLMNAGDVQSHAVYPLASNVALNPPDGNEDASGSPLISSFPENSSKTLPSSVGLMKASCFSAVTPVNGWNQ